jgi:hypothetical protein
MRITPIQNRTNFTGLINVENFNRLTSDMQAKITSAMNTQHAYGTAQAGKFFGDDNFARAQMDALKKLGVTFQFQSTSFRTMSAGVTPQLRTNVLKGNFKENKSFGINMAQRNLFRDAKR